MATKRKKRKSKWNPVTRCVKYDPTKVAAACRRFAAECPGREHRPGCIHSDKCGGDRGCLWEYAAREVEADEYEARRTAMMLLRNLENHDTE